jgi:nitroreductase
MKSLLKKLLQLLPASFSKNLIHSYRQTRERWALRRAYAHDRRWFARESGLFSMYQRASSLEAALIKAYHRVEKGLALAEPRPGFGRDAIETLLEDGRCYAERYGSNLTIRRLLNTLVAYQQFNQAQGADVSWLQPRLQKLQTLAQGAPSSDEGGVRAVSAAEIKAAANVDFTRFVEHRFSIRQFSDEPVTQAQIEQAVLLAKRSPSVCNRESGHVFVASSAASKARVLALQNGNRGFGDQASKVLIITSRVDTFMTVGERYQCWIDGGLFAMSLIYALHAQGLGTCCLNWSVEPDVDLALKKAAGIPEGHAVIMQLAVGHIPTNLTVAQSPRRPLAEVLHFLS